MSFYVVCFAFLIAISAAELTDWTNVLPLEVLPEHLFNHLPVVSPRFVQARITGGIIVEPHSVPYQASLIIKLQSGTAYCGGSLISNKFVLTAAHCVENAQLVNVLLGAHNLNKDEIDRIENKVESSGITVHKNWDSKAIRNDIALIELPFPVEFSDKIRAINLPRKSDVSQTFVFQSAIASGWGQYSDWIQNISPELRSVNTIIMQQEKCKERYRQILQDSHICTTGADGKSTCRGDSGGPLAVFEGQSRVLVGITSFGSAVGCARNYPAVFTRVTSFLDWIVENTGIKLRI